MRAITTKYFGPGNVRGSRVKASAGDGATASLPWNYALSPAANHAAAAVALARKLGWTGTLIEGHAPEGMAFVFAEGDKHVV
jgi:hypothetical protein